MDGLISEVPLSLHERKNSIVFLKTSKQAVMGKSSLVSSCVYICEISQLMLWSHFMYTH